MTDACKAAAAAEDALAAAITDRRAVVQRLWPTIYRFGPKWLSHEVGEDIVTSSNLRSLAKNLTPRPGKGPFMGPGPDQKERAAVAELATVCRAVVDAYAARGRAINERSRVIREHYSVVVVLGPTRLERAIGRQYVGESTIRAAVAEINREL